MLAGKLGSSGRAATVIVVARIGVLMVPIYLLAQSMTDSVQGALATVQGRQPACAATSRLRGHLAADRQAPACGLVAGRDRPDQPDSEHAGRKIKDVSLGAAGQVRRPRRRPAAVHRRADHRRHLHGLRRERRTQRGARSPRASSARRAARQSATLCTATIRAVAQGVVGIAFIQMLLVGVGFALMGMPGAGVLALLVLLLGIVQTAGDPDHACR